MKREQVDRARVQRAMRDFAGVVGESHIFFTEEDQRQYSDHFASEAGEQDHRPAGAISPANVEELQELVRIANRHAVPLWPISRGKNFGYGGAAPVLKGSVVLDLSRMKKIEIDERNGVVVVEPGVGFFDLYDFIQSRRLPYWLSVPGNSFGSVAGNALDRGMGYTPYGDHSTRICGLEVVLPDGGLVRTGMGATGKGPAWHLHRSGFGPGWDSMFCQSNFGIVTKLGLWLMPEPEAVLGLNIDVDKPEDLGWLINTLAPLRREGILQQSPSIGNWLRAAAVLTRRDDWVKSGERLSDDAIAAIRGKFGIGWWGVTLRVYGRLEVAEATQNVLRKAFNGKPVWKMAETRWEKGGAPEGTPVTGVPVTFPLSNANWFGGRGGHLGFSPVLPVDGDLALRYFKRNYELHDQYGFDYHPSFAILDRSMNNINQLLFDRDNDENVKNVDKLFNILVREAAEEGFAEYRAHISYMDTVSDTYDFNGHALRRLNETVKNALDPNGIIAPGKSGIWPASHRSSADA